MSIIDHISSPLINALAWSLLHSIWQILAITVIWRIAVVLCRKAPAQVRYNISLLALLAVPIAFVFTFINQYEMYNNARRIVLFEFDSAALLNIREEASFFLLQKNSPSFLQFIEQHSLLVFWVYLGGITLVSIYFILTYSKLYVLRRKSLLDIPDNLKSKAVKARNKLKIGKNVKVYLSERISIPVVIGFIKPIILLPVAMIGSLSIQEAESILLHEFYHIRRKDHYVNALQYLLEIAFFYHPFIWWISGSLRKEREKCVDEWVVSQTGQPLLYAKALLNLEENRTEKTQVALAASESNNKLLTRIKNIMSMKTRKFNLGQKMAAIFVITLAVITVAWLNPSGVSIAKEANSGEDLSWVETNMAEKQDKQSDQDVKSRDNRKEQGKKDEPKRIYLDDGTAYDWDDLSEEDKEEVRQAMKEVRSAMEEVNKEVFEKLNSEEFKNEMKAVGEEISRAMEEVNRELNSEEFRNEISKAREEMRIAFSEINNEEFRKEMEDVRKEIKEAMKEVHEELNSEEFKKEMQEAREEVRRAMEEVNQELNSEEFKNQMNITGEVMSEIFKEMESVDWEVFGETMKVVMEETGKTMEMIGPAIQESLKSIDAEYEERPENE